MELDQPQVFDPRAQFMGQGDAVAGGDGGVGGIGVHPPNPPRAEHAVGAGKGAVAAVGQQPGPETALRRRQRRKLGVFHQGDVGLGLGHGQQLFGDLPGPVESL